MTIESVLAASCLAIRAGGWTVLMLEATHERNVSACSPFIAARYEAAHTTYTILFKQSN